MALATVSPPPAMPADTHEDDALQMLDGCVLTAELVERQVLFHVEQQAHHVFEAGKWLAAWKDAVGDTNFGGWCAKKLPFTRRTADRYIQAYTFLAKHPRLQAPLGRAGLKKTLLLSTLAPDQLEMVVQEGRVGDADIDGIDEIPYVALKQKVARLERDLGKTKSELEGTASSLEKARTRIGELDGTLRPDDQEVLDRLDAMRKTLDGVLLEYGMLADSVGGRLDEAHPAVRGHLRGFGEYVLVRAELEHVRMRIIAGEAHLSEAMLEIEARPRTGAQVYSIPQSRRAARFPDHGPANK